MWVVVALTMLAFVATAGVVLPLVLVAFAVLFNWMLPSGAPAFLDFIAVVVVLGIAIIPARLVNLQLRGSRRCVARSCLMCGVSSHQSQYEFFCPHCGEVVVRGARLLRPGDWWTGIWNAALLWVVLLALMPMLGGILGLRFLFFNPIVNAGGALFISMLNAVLFYRGRTSQRKAELEAQRVTNGTHCPCGYNLTGNESGACPECGISTTNPEDD